MSPKEPNFTTADICDRFSSSVEVCAPIFKGFGAVAAFAGPISTVEVYEDNVLVRGRWRTLRRVPFWSWTEAVPGVAPCWGTNWPR